MSLGLPAGLEDAPEVEWRAEVIRTIRNLYNAVNGSSDMGAPIDEASQYLQANNNLSDLTNINAARNNLQITETTTGIDSISTDGDYAFSTVTNTVSTSSRDCQGTTYIQPLYYDGTYTDLGFWSVAYAFDFSSKTVTGAWSWHIHSHDSLIATGGRSETWEGGVFSENLSSGAAASIDSALGGLALRNIDFTVQSPSGSGSSLVWTVDGLSATERSRMYSVLTAFA